MEIDSLPEGALITVSLMQMLRLTRATNVPQHLPLRGLFQFKKVVRGDIHEWEFVKTLNN